VNFAVDFAWDKSGEFDVRYGFGNRSFYLVLKQDNEICQNASFRKAVDLALDRKRIIETMRDLTSIENVQFLPRRHLYNLLMETPSQNDGSSYDPDGAKECWTAAKASLSEADLKDFTFKIAYLLADDKVNQMRSKLLDNIVGQLQAVGIDAKPEEKNDLDKAHALVEVINFDTPDLIYANLHSQESDKEVVYWKYKNPYMDNLLENIRGTETYRRIQEILSAEGIFIPLFRHGRAITHTKDLDTKSRLRVTSLLYGPDVVHWEFK
jgi:ABC-type transport system substrate-binding protein